MAGMAGTAGVGRRSHGIGHLLDPLLHPLNESSSIRPGWPECSECSEWPLGFHNSPISLLCPTEIVSALQGGIYSVLRDTRGAFSFTVHSIIYSNDNGMGEIVSL